jgi:hypothetical protein
MVTPTIPRLPKVPQKPYIRPKAKAMTIGIGFHSMDGVIMGADRQMTSTGWHKYEEQKLFHHMTDDRALVLIGGNELGLAKELWWKLVEYPISDYESCQQALTATLDGMGRLNTDLPLELLCGIATKKNTYLFGFRGKGIYPVMDELGVICAGDSSLIRYLAKNIDLFWQWNDGGIAVATYLLKRAEEFVDGCKGPMDVVVLEPGPKIRILDPAMIEKIDMQLVKNQSKAFTDLLSLCPPSSI